MDEVYNGYRIALTNSAGCWLARITHVRGNVAPFGAKATIEEGAETCAARARDMVDKYAAFLARPDGYRDEA